MRHRATAALAITCVLAVTGCTFENSTATPDHPKVATSHTAHPGKPRHIETPTKTPTKSHSPQPGGTSTPTATDGTALAALAALPVKGRAPMTGYDRDQFGTEWDDAVTGFVWSRNGCDTRNDVLARDLQRETVESNGCVVISGVLAYEPYTGDTNRPFVRGGAYEESFDVEHIVALGNAWATGAQQLTPAQRASIANDPINLMLADPSLNRSKGDADFATWLPPNKAFRCSYAARQIRVKTKYHLWVTAPEKAAMEQVLATCPDEPLDQPDVQEGHKATTGAPTSHTTSPSPATTTSGQGSGQGATSVYYANCDAVRAAGAAPIHRGDPGYSTSLDRDQDGIGCE